MAEPRTPLEKLAKLQATPVPRKMVPTVKPVSKPGQVDPNDPWGVLGKSTTSTGAAANVPGNKPFVGPTLDPEVMQARSRLKAEELKAIQAGVAPGDVASIVSGKGDPNRGFLGPAKFVGNVIKGVGGAITPDVIPFTRIDSLNQSEKAQQQLDLRHLLLQARH
jgi:hypothetical protein